MPVRWVTVRPQGAASRVGTQCGSSSSTRAASSRPPGVIVGTLSDGPVRYSDLACAIPGISQRMLTLTLKRLQRSGLVDRTAYAEVPAPRRILPDRARELAPHHRAGAGNPVRRPGTTRSATTSAPTTHETPRRQPREQPLRSDAARSQADPGRPGRTGARHRRRTAGLLTTTPHGR